MDKEILIEVTLVDIDTGCRWEANNCPVARAVKRSTGAYVVAVTPTEILWKMESGIAYYDLTPAIVRTFMSTFDHGHFCSPFSFVLSPKVAETALWRLL